MVPRSPSGGYPPGVRFPPRPTKSASVHDTSKRDFMNKLNSEKRCQIISALVEGNSMRATARMTGVMLNTVLKLLPEIGKACAEYQRRVFRDLPCKRIQC